MLFEKCSINVLLFYTVSAFQRKNCLANYSAPILGALKSTYIVSSIYEARKSPMGYVWANPAASLLA